MPLAAPVNPYRRDYDPWDKWIFEHAVSSSDSRIEDYFRGEGGRNNVVIDAYVDSSGFLVPQRVAEQRRLHTEAIGHDSEPVYMPQWTHVLFAAGPIEPELLEAYEQAMLKLRAEYTVPIPGWLAANPPAWALILPPEAGAHAGEVVMYGKPGVDQDYALPHGEIRPAITRAVFYRYSATGKLLEQTTMGQEWWELYTANPATPEGPGSTSIYKAFEAVGVISITDIRSGKRAWLMDISGKHMEDKKQPDPRNGNHWLGLTASELKAVYAIQQAVPETGPKGKPKPKRSPPRPLGGSKGL